jgi:hypothetical protein
MDNPDSDDYELMPSHELDDLRHEVSALKKGSMTDGDKARVLIESMDRLVVSINRLITILDDAQKDIIDEYQQSKPAEKLNQLLDQNEMIARALIAISDNMSGNPGGSRSLIPPSQSQYPGYSNQSSMPQQNISMGNPRSILSSPNMPSMGQQMNQQSMQFNPSMSMGSPSMPPMDDLPPMNSIPPLDNSVPNVPKKKFLGIM